MAQNTQRVKRSAVVGAIALVAFSGAAHADPTFLFVLQNRAVEGRVYYGGELRDSDTVSSTETGPFSASVDAQAPQVSATGEATQNSTLDPVSGISLTTEIYAFGNINSSQRGEARTLLDATFDIAAPITLYVDMPISYGGRFTISGPGINQEFGPDWFSAVPLQFQQGTYRVVCDMAGSTIANTPPLQRLLTMSLRLLRINAPLENSGSAGAGCLAPVPDFVSGATVDSSCGAVTLTQSPPAGTLVGRGLTAVTLTGTCVSGAIGTKTVYFNVTDTTPPTINSCAPARSVAAGTNEMAAVPSVIGSVSASDACGGVTITQSPTAGTLVPLGPRVITINVRDTANQNSQCQSMLYVTPKCQGDLNLDGSINTADLTIFLSFFGSAGSLYPRADCNADGLINTSDLTLFISRFGTSCP